MFSCVAKANTVSFSQSAYRVNEDSGSVEIQLILSNSTSADVNIEILTEGGTANGKYTECIYDCMYVYYYYTGEDYEPGPYDVIISAEMTSVLFNITITNDDVYEGNETFNLIVNVSSLSSNVTVGDISQATITIMNDDGKQYKTKSLID